MEVLKQYRILLLACVLVAVAAIFWFSGAHAPGATEQAATFRGRLTYLDYDRRIFYLQNDTAAVRVEADNVESRMEVGQLIEATGTLASDRDAPTLLSTQINILEPGVIPNAVPLTGAELSNNYWRNRRIYLSGQVIKTDNLRLGQIYFQLRLADKTSVEVRAFNDDPKAMGILAGARIAVPGVLYPLPHSGDLEAQFALLVNHRDLYPVVEQIRKLRPATEQSTPNKVLTTISEIRRLAKSDADRGFPVLVRGVITFIDVDPNHFYFFVKDGTGGIYVNLRRWEIKGLKTGDRVTVTGHTASGSFAPIISGGEIHLNGGTETLQPTPYPVIEVLAGRSDGDWLALRGIVHTVGQNSSRAQLVFEWNGVQITALFGPGVVLPSNLIDATVELQGVSGSNSNLRGQFTGMRLFVPSLSYLRIVKPSPSDADIPLKNNESLGTFTADAQWGHREKIKGRITYTTPSGPTFVHDQTGDVRIDGAPDRRDLRVGDEVEVLGFPVQDNIGSVMKDAHFLLLGRNSSRIEPYRATVEALKDHGLEGSLVQVEAILTERFSSEGGEKLVMRSGPTVFNARVIAGRAPEAANGSTLRLTGICRLTSNEDNPGLATGFDLLLLGGASVKVVQKAPWWTARAVLWAVIFISVLTVLVIVWAFALRRQVQRQTRVIRTQLEEAESLRNAAEAAARAKSEFLANMSHEIRTPLNGVLGMTELAVAEAGNSKVKEYLDIVRTSGLSLLQIINDILDLSKIEAGRMTVESVPFNLHQVLAHAAALFKPTADGKKLSLALQYPDNAPRCFVGDGTRVRQIILNLVSNALKFTERGGVSIEVQISPLEEQRALVRIAVVDTGVGIPLEAQSKLFQSFTQADASTTRRFGGTGLGLAISRQLCKLMGGTMGLTSQPGQGSTFWLELPLPITESVPEEEVSARAPLHSDPNAAPLRVLLAEDNLVNQKVAGRMLERLGVEVDIVGNGFEAVTKVKEQRYSLILMDCQMPLCDGYEATSAIRAWERSAQLSPIPIIALTAHALPGDRQRCLQAGMDDYLTKPLRADDLRQAVKQWTTAAVA